MFFTAIYNTKANPRIYDCIWLILLLTFKYPICGGHLLFMDPYNRLGGSNLNNNWKSSFANWKGWSGSRGWSLAPWRPRTVFSSCSFLQWSRTRPWRLLSIVRSIFWLRPKTRSLRMIWVGFSPFLVCFMCTFDPFLSNISSSSTLLPTLMLKT